MQSNGNIAWQNRSRNPICHHHHESNQVIHIGRGSLGFKPSKPPKSGRPTASTVSREVFIRLPPFPTEHSVQVKGKLHSQIRKGNNTEERVPAPWHKGEESPLNTLPSESSPPRPFVSWNGNMRDDGEGDERRLKYFPFNASKLLRPFDTHSLTLAAARIEKFNYKEGGGVVEMDRLAHAGRSQVWIKFFMSSSNSLLLLHGSRSLSDRSE